MASILVENIAQIVNHEVHDDADTVVHLEAIPHTYYVIVPLQLSHEFYLLIGCFFLSGVPAFNINEFNGNRRVL